MSGGAEGKYERWEWDGLSQCVIPSLVDDAELSFGKPFLALLQIFIE